MTSRHILYADAAGLVAYRRQRGGIGLEGEFAADAAGCAAFEAWLAQRRSGIFRLLADVADEDFHTEDIPYVGGRDRAALLRRKLDQHRRGTPLAVALPQGRLAQGRRDERVLFASLTHPQLFAPWLDALTRAGAALAGIHSLPQAMVGLPEAQAHERALLVTISRAGLRQTLFENGQLRFSRLTALASTAPAEAAVACADEAARIRPYADSHGLIAGDGPLAVLILVHPAHAGAFRQRCRDSADLRFEFLDLVAVARRHGLATPPADCRSEVLFAHLLSRRPPRRQYANNDVRRHFRLRQARIAFAAGTWATLALGLAVAGLQWHEADLLRRETAALHAQIERDADALRARQASLPATPIAADRLRAVVERHAQLVRTSPGPTPLYRRLGAVLAEFPEIELERLDWSLAEGGADGPAAVVDVHGVLPAEMAQDQNRQIAAIEALRTRLGGAGGIRARATSLPFDADSGRVLTSAAANAEPLRFALRVSQAL